MGDVINRLEVLVKRIYYIFERFQIESTFALLYHKDPLNVVEFSKCVRLSDQFIPLDDNHYFIIFEFTNQENAYKASQNIIFKLDKYFNSTNECYIALDAFDIHKSPQTVLSRLQQILLHTRKEIYTRVETEYILER
jgi:hypothetical protein